MAAATPIRPIAPPDADLVATIIRAAFAATEVPLDPPPSALQVTPEAIRAHLQEGGGALYRQAGCVLWALKDGGLYISRLAVLPASRSQGIASALLACAEAEARRLALPHLHLATRLALAGNRRLFARAGFVEGAQHAHEGYSQTDLRRSRETTQPLAVLPDLRLETLQHGLNPVPGRAVHPGGEQVAPEGALAVLELGP